MRGSRKVVALLKTGRDAAEASPWCLTAQRNQYDVEVKTSGALAALTSQAVGKHDRFTLTCMVLIAACQAQQSRNGFILTATRSNTDVYDIFSTCDVASYNNHY
jgi:hypothetical protein